MARIGAAVARRLRGPYESLDRIEGQVNELKSGVAKLESSQWHSQILASRLHDDLRDALRALAANEPQNRRSLQAVREGSDYQQAWDEDAPLISVTVATLGRPELISRSLPSILGQSYGKLEVIVAADGATAETESAVAELGDPRVRYLDLGPRQTWTDDPVKLWLVGATRARNASVSAARGHWIVEFDDDDAMRPDCLEVLIDLARRTKAEAVYGQVRQHAADDPVDLCAFPPRFGRFSWAAGMYHGGLRFFGRELLAADLGLPGDWWLAERMLRAGVRFAMRDEVLCDAYASDRARNALEHGRIPWVGDERQAQGDLPSD
ncbi:MAG TPA: glycosyltransferase family 2 protein [Solirubrobacterales bacterium]|jgi:hypothetical protein